MDVPGIGPISGLFAGIAWKARLPAFLFLLLVFSMCMTTGPVSDVSQWYHAWLQGFETYSQFSFRNLCLVSLDWVSFVIMWMLLARTAALYYRAAQPTRHWLQVRTKIFGRDISRV
jgi:hypothetical protein